MATPEGQTQSIRAVSSARNGGLKLIRQLKTRKGRDRTGCYLLEGPKLVWEALDSGAELVLAVFRQEALGAREAELARRLGALGVSVASVDGKLFDQLADADSPQPVLAAARKPQARPGDGGGDWLLLDRVQEPGNIGALMRSAEAAGFGTVLAVKGSGDLYAPKTVRASAGAASRMALIQAGSPAEAADMARRQGKTLLAADPGGELNVYELDLRGPLALAIGNEGGGLSPEFRQAGALVARIPMPGRAESLNAGAAAAVIMFEALRQRAAKR